MTPTSAPRRLLAALTILPLLVVGAVAVAPARADVADASGRQQTEYTTKALPTVQVNGVVWDQLVVGDVVYVVGQFSSARPAGAQAGTDETPRSNILAYDLNTGDLIDDFAPVLNNAGRTLALSDDGKTLYVGGSFDKVDGAWHGRLAAFDISQGHGTLIPSFRPMFSTTVNTIDVHGSTVYAGGAFSTVNGTARAELAAVDASTGTLLDWTADAVGPNSQVYGLKVSPDGSKVVVGGSFQTLNGSSNPGYGLAMLDASTGSLLATPVNSAVRNGGRIAGIRDIEVDDTGFYGTGYSMSFTEANLEGSFHADWDGNLIWVEPCHGDTYSIAPDDDEVYTVSHAHSCETIGGFGDRVRTTSSGTSQLISHRGLAFTNSPDVDIQQTGTGKYASWFGYKSPELLDWYPDLTVGTYTGMQQAAYDVTLTDDYLLLGGEFMTADGSIQEGLVRYPRRTAGGSSAPRGVNGDLTLRAVSEAPGVVNLSLPAAWDTDSSTVTYSFHRDGSSTPVCTSSDSTRSWLPRAQQTCTDRDVPAGAHTYTATITDSDGTTTTPDAVSVTVAGQVDPSVSGASSGTGLYDQAVLADGASHLWRLDDTGTSLADGAGSGDMTTASGVTTGSSGFRDGSSAVSLDGTAKATAQSVESDGDVQTFSLETWVRTSSTAGGAILGYSNNIGNYDRLLYMDGDGHLLFGLYPGAYRILTSPDSYNDGQWHHVVATLGSAGEILYVDGQQVASDTTTTSAQAMGGYWTLGVGSLGWPGAPSSATVLKADVDETAVYPTQLDADAVARHHDLGLDEPPTASFTASEDYLDATLDASASAAHGDGTIADYAWDFGDGSTGTGETAEHAYTTAGTYTVTLTVTDALGATSTTTSEVVVTAPPLAADSFDRTATAGWGDAETGGAWTVSPASRFSVADGAGVIAMDKAGSTSTASLAGVSSASTTVEADYTYTETLTGGGAYTTVNARQTAAGSYGVKVRATSSGTLLVNLVRKVGSTETSLGSTSVKGWSAGDTIHVSVTADGTGTTNLAASVWLGATAPDAAMLTATDSTEGLQVAGAVGVSEYLSSGSTSTTDVMRLDGLTASSAD